MLIYNTTSYCVIRTCVNAAYQMRFKHQRAQDKNKYTYFVNLPLKNAPEDASPKDFEHLSTIWTNLILLWLKCLPTWCLLLHDKLTVTDVDLVGIPNHFIGVLVPDALRILHWKRSNIAVYGCFLLSDYFQNFDLFALFDPFQEKKLSMYMGIEPGIVPMICCL